MMFSILASEQWDGSRRLKYACYQSRNETLVMQLCVFRHDIQRHSKRRSYRWSNFRETCWVHSDKFIGSNGLNWKLCLDAKPAWSNSARLICYSSKKRVFFNLLKRLPSKNVLGNSTNQPGRTKPSKQHRVFGFWRWFWRWFLVKKKHHAHPSIRIGWIIELFSVVNQAGTVY